NVDKKGTENVMSNHLSPLPEFGTKGAQVPVIEEFPGEQLRGVEQDTSAPAFNSS
ncbi:hypothetical protein Dimus_024537, partial [Dionaea muscipula]